jgi:hypothetical protein
MNVIKRTFPTREKLAIKYDLVSHYREMRVSSAKRERGVRDVKEGGAGR